MNEKLSKGKREMVQNTVEEIKVIKYKSKNPIA